MEIKVKLLEPLLEKAEAYGETSMELLKLKALDKTADITATLISRFLLSLVVLILVFTLNIAIAFWLGDMLGKVYYGFLVVAACYALAGIILLLIHPFIKTRVQNTLIRQMFN